MTAKMITVNSLYLQALLGENKKAKCEFSNDYEVFAISNDKVKVEISGYRITRNEGIEEPMLSFDVDNLLDLHISVLSICGEQIQVNIDRYFLNTIKHIVENNTEDYAEKLRKRS